MALNEKKKPEQSELYKKFKQNPLMFSGTVLILILVIVTFVFWGAGDWILPRGGMLSNNDLAFGYYNKIPIELTPGSFFAEQRKYFIDQMRGNERYATERAFDIAVVRTAIIDIMKQARYEPSKSVVDRKAAQLPQYQEDGVFSLLRWRREPQSARLQVLKNLRDDIITMRYYADVAALEIEEGQNGPEVWTAPKYSYSVLTASNEAGFVGAMAKTQRKFRIAVFPYASFPADEVSAFAAKNAALFTKTHLFQITLSGAKDASEAQKVLDSIKSGSTTFEDAAKTHSDDMFKQSGGDAGERMAFELVPLISNEAERTAVVNLKAGEMSAPVKTSSGWVLFRAESDPESADANNAAVLTTIRNYMNTNERGIIEDWLIARANNFAKDAVSNWSKAVIAFNVDAKEFGPLPLNYGDSTLFTRVRDFAGDVPALSGAGESELFWKNAFSTPVGTISAPFVISSGDETVVALMPIEEIADTSESVTNTAKLYATSFIEGEIARSVDDAVLQSGKFVNHFDERYARIFAGQTQY